MQIACFQYFQGLENKINIRPRVHVNQNGQSLAKRQLRVLRLRLPVYPLGHSLVPPMALVMIIARDGPLVQPTLCIQQKSTVQSYTPPDGALAPLSASLPSDCLKYS